MESFDITNIKRTDNVLVVGGRGSGKTVLISDIGGHMDLHKLHPYLRACDDDAVDDSIIETMIAKQTKNDTNTAMVFDNCLWVYSKPIKQLFENSKQLKIFLLHSHETMHAIPRSLAERADYVFFFPGACDQVDVWETFMGTANDDLVKPDGYSAVVIDCVRKTASRYTAKINWY